MQPFLLVLDTRTDDLYRVAADGQSKVLITDDTAQMVDQLFLAEMGAVHTEIIDQGNIINDWLDSIPTVP